MDPASQGVATLYEVEEQCAIFISHMYEFHCVSTEPLINSSSIFQ